MAISRRPLECKKLYMRLRFTPTPKKGCGEKRRGFSPRGAKRPRGRFPAGNQRGGARRLPRRKAPIKRPCSPQTTACHTPTSPADLRICGSSPAPPAEAGAEQKTGRRKIRRKNFAWRPGSLEKSACMRYILHQKAGYSRNNYLYWVLFWAYCTTWFC